MASSPRAVDVLALQEAQSRSLSFAGLESGWANGSGKRLFDVVFAASATLVAAPVIAVVAAAIKLSSRGPVLFKQVRMGRDGHPFTILKFRTMRLEDGPLVTARNDSRITRVGRLLRRTKIDELPQLLNVLAGDMSVVGPRPKVYEHQSSPLFCRPGLTGAATLAFIEEEKLLMDVPEHELVTYTVQVLHQIKSDVDREYARTSTWFTDMILLASTALHLFQVRRSSRVNAMNERILEAQRDGLSMPGAQNAASDRTTFPR